MGSKVYIIMPCYNGEKYLLEQLMSIYYQNYTNWYLLFINDGSTDNSENIVRDWISHYNLHDKVKVINKENGGVNSAVQRGLEEVKNMYDINLNNLVSYCDADDVWTRDKLEIQVKYMIDHPECDLSYHDLSKIDENGKIIKQFRMKDFYPKRGDLFLLTIGNYITSTTMMFNAKYIDYLIPMPIGFGVYQDYWTALVFSINKFNIFFIDKSLCYYRTGHESLIKIRNGADAIKRNNSRMKYFYTLKSKFPKIHMGYVLNYNEDRYINRYNKGYKLPHVHLLMLLKYPNIFLLCLKIQIRNIFHIVKNN